MSAWTPIIIGCSAFLGTFAANLISESTPKPRHPKRSTAQRFPLDLDTADHPTGDHPQHVRPGEGEL